LRKLGVHIRLRVEVTTQLLKSFSCDAVIVSTGASVALPSVPGIEKVPVFQARDAILENINLRKRVVVIGGGMVGCETAEYFAAKGKMVTIIEALPELAMNMRPTARKILLGRIGRLPIDIIVGAECSRIGPDFIEIAETGGTCRRIEPCSVICAVGAASNDTLGKSLTAMPASIEAAGDCVKPQGIAEAIDDGMRIALGIN
jgi:pyruvate/2-oxoglutarate dehydrogenase complex dihydrolipoamide dehydrogenase (E3) component